MTNTDYLDFDRRIWEEELEEFVPSVVYDMHTHMWSEEHKGQAGLSSLRWEAGYQDHVDWAARLYPGREAHFLVLGTPIVGIDIEGHNDWLALEIAADPQSAVNLLVVPEMTPEYVAEQVRKHDFLGLKPYRLFAPDPANARIQDFLPESFIEVAHDLGLAITMHLSKKTGPADPDNLKDLEYYTHKYPRAQWILAHCARAFNPFMLEESVHRLKDIPNIWYDTSAVNDMYSHFLLMKYEDRKRVMYGSDNIAVGCDRGKYVTYGKAWQHFEGFPDLTHCDPTATFIIYEQLRQERQVAEILGLSKDEIEDHFSGNAIRFLNQVRSARG